MNWKEFIQQAMASQVNVFIVGENKEKKHAFLQEVVNHLPDGPLSVLDKEGITHFPNVSLNHVTLVFDVFPHETQTKQLKAAAKYGRTRLVISELDEGLTEAIRLSNFGHQVLTTLSHSSFEPIVSQFIKDTKRDFPNLSSHQTLRFIEEGLELFCYVEETNVQVGYLTVDRGTSDFSFHLLYEVNGEEGTEASEDMSKAIQRKFDRLEKQLQKEKRLKKKQATSYIETIDYNEFFTLFQKKYNFKKWNALKPLFRETISIVRNLADDENIPVGASKFGGNPDLPKGNTYPYYDENVPYSFVMQINCEEVAPYDKQGLFPTTGMLYFFRASEDEEFFLSQDFLNQKDFKGYLKTAHVLYFEGSTNELVRTKLPNSDHIEELNTAHIHFVRSLSLPRPFEQEELYEAQGFTEDDMEEALDDLHSMLPRLPFESPEEVFKDFNEPFQRPFHQLLGEPYFHQAPPQDMLYSELRKFNQPEEASHKWILLTQFCDDDLLDLMWLAGGTGFYYIKEDDLKNRNFTRIYTVVECG